MIVDDEPLAIKVIENHLKKVSELEVVATCTSAITAYEIIQKQDIDLIFLDIQMPELSGIEFIRSLEQPPKIIFTTAHRDYALEGFELDVVDYLLKPVSLPRLLRALDKYRRLTVEAASPSGPEHANTRMLTVRSNRQTIRLAVEDILYIESLSDYVKIYTSDQTIVSKDRISHLTEKLSAYGFIRIHRSFLVAQSKISSYNSELVYIQGKALPISRSYKHAVKTQLGSVL